MGRRPKKLTERENPDLPRPERTASQVVARSSGGRLVPEARDCGAVTVLAVCGLLLAAVALVFGQTVRHEFINYDDDLCVYENPPIARGLTALGIAWTVTHSHVGNWHPLTSISHMLDCQFYELWAGGHHLTNVLLHGATSVLLMLVLRRMTGQLWPSALVAALFAIHPLRVESVAWVAERKDVLSGLLFMLTLWAYVGYVRRPSSLWRYTIVATLFALGLMAKPMLVTMPLVLLLLDYWPLGRFTVGDVSNGHATASGPALPEGSHPAAVAFDVGVAPAAPPRSTRGSAYAMRMLIVEKIPLLALAAASCVATLLAQGKAVVTSELIPLPTRIVNALVSYAAYLGQMFYPARLAVLYPHPGNGLPMWQIFGSLVLLAGVSAAALVWRRKCPYLLVGWLWYLGTLVPVIGLVQVGSQARADRYTYLTQIGLLIAVVWGLAHALRPWSHRRWAYAAVSIVVLTSLTVCAYRQTTFWKSNKTLWPHTLACTSHNSLACLNLGSALQKEGNLDAAIEQLEKALEIRPNYLKALNNLGAALAGRGRVDEAIVRYQQALAIDPQHADTHNNLGVALLGRGQVDDAMAHYTRALEINPEYADAYNNLSVALAGRGRIDDAIANWRRALEVDPRHFHSRQNLGSALFQKGRIPEAMAQWHEAIRLRPNDAVLLNGVARVLAGYPDKSVRNGTQAVELAQRAVELSGGREPEFLKTLADAYAEAGRPREAVDVARQGLSLAMAQGKTALADAFRSQIQAFQASNSSRDATGPATERP